MNPEGTHYIAEISNCRKPLNDAKCITDLCTNAARYAGATVIDSAAHSFRNGGVTVLIMLAESHISVHTWPEKGYAAVDIYTCGVIDSHKILRDIAMGLDGFCFYMGLNRGVDHRDVHTMNIRETTTGTRFK